MGPKKFRVVVAAIVVVLAMAAGAPLGFIINAMQRLDETTEQLEESQQEIAENQRQIAELAISSRERQRVILCRLIDTKKKQIEARKILKNLITGVQDPDDENLKVFDEALNELNREIKGLKDGISILKYELNRSCGDVIAEAMRRP